MTGEPSGMFEAIYAGAEAGEAKPPWDYGAPRPQLVEWAEARDLTGGGREALVVGCGYGADAELLASLGFRTTGFDFAPTAIAGARRRYPASEVTYVVADVLDLPREWQRRFDLVVESLTVQSMPPEQHAAAAQSIAGLVAPGGTLLVLATTREEESEVKGPPWPLTRSELEDFASGGLILRGVERIESGTWWRAELSGVARFEDQDLTDAEFRECDLTRARLIGVVMQDAVIDGLVTNLVVNGVEVMSYVEAELDRRHPVRPLMRSTDPADLREAERQLRAAWAATVARLRSSAPGLEHQRVGGEWSAVETLRHLVFVHDSWFRRCCLGSPEPFTAIGLATDFVPDQEEQGLDRAAAPGLDQVWAVREEQAAELERWLASVTPEELATVAPVPAGPGWPPYAAGKTVVECLHVVLNEEWAHHGFCVRDLDLLE